MYVVMLEWNDKWKNDKCTCKTGFLSFPNLKETLNLMKHNHHPLFWKQKKKLKSFGTVTRSQRVGVLHYITSAGKHT